MIGARLANRFLIASEIGRGGMGVVYLAHDPMLDREVAVKLVPPNLLRPEAAERLKREARVIAKLDHPGIVVVHDIGEHEGSLFFVMPLLQGRNLRDFIRSEKVTVQELLEIISQAAEALEYSHAHGVVHRDVKPENIMVTRDHNEGLRVRMTDFGLAIGSTDQRITASGSLIGTAAYLSPEQVSNQEVDARSDIYSLATILYECLVGEPPFGVDLVGVLYRVLHENPQSPRSVGVEIPPELDDLILRALEKSPDKRPQSAGQMAEELRRCSAGLVESLLSAEVSTTTSPTVRYDRAQHLAPFVGREKEFADLQRKLNAALSGECQFVVIGGDVGIGKSRLAEEIERLSRARKIQVLHGRFFDHDRGFPYQGFCEVLQEYFRRRKEGARADFSDLAGDLESIFPVLAEIDEIRFAAGDGERPQPPVEMRKMDDRTYIFELIARSITRISAGHPLVLILEDLHAADVSVDALQYVVRRLGPTPTLILATYDSSDVDRSHPLNRMLANFKGDRRFQQFVLQPLGPAEHRSFLQQTIGSTNLDDAFVQRIYEATEGNPYFTRELVRSLVDSGGVVRSVSGSFALSGDSGIFTDALPVTIQQAVENRIERLPEELREILFAASVLGRRFKIRDLEAVLEGGDELEDSIDKLIDSGFVQEDRESSRDLVSFSSGIVRDVLYSALPRRKRKALHRRYAMFLETRHADRLDQVLAPLLHHYTQADVTEKIIEYGLRLARKSVEAFSPEDAIYAAKIVIDVLEDDPAVEVEAQILLADGYRMAGNTEAALKEFERAGKTAEHSGDGQALIQTILKAAETSWEGRNIDETRRWSERGVEVSRSVGDDNSLSRLLSLGATVANLRGEYGKAKEYLDEVERLRPASRDRKSELPRGGRLIVGMSHPVQIKHPAEITLAEEGEVLASVFEPLVSTDAQGTVVPCLCERWEILDAGRSFLFEVRRGITMHDGRPFTSTEVQLAIQEAIRHRKSTPLAAYAVLQGVEEFLSGQTESISGIVIVSDYKLLFHLTEPLPLFPALLTDVRTGLARVASDGLRSRLIGTGPFMVSQQHPDRVVLQRNPNYWRLGAPALDAIEFRAGMSAAELASGFVSGELDLARDLLPDDLDQIIRNRELRAGIVEATKKNVYFVLFNQSSPVARAPGAFRAMAGIVRTHDLVRRTLGRLAHPAEGLLPPGILGYNPSRRRQPLSREAAVDLLRSAVGADLPLRLKAAVHPILQDRYGQLTNALLEIWSEIGVEISIVTSTMSSYLEKWENNDQIDLFIGRHIADYDDPDNFTYGMFHSAMGALRKYCSNPELDELFEQARIASSPTVREKLYRRAENLIMESDFLLPLFHELDYRVYNPRLSNLTLRSNPPYVNYSEVAKSTAQAKVANDRGGIIYAPIGQQMRSLDPSMVYRKWEDEVIPTIYETLTRVVEGARVVPWLAAELHTEEGGRRFRFRLRDDVRFHNGRLLTARDVRYSFETLLQRDRPNRWLLSPIRGAAALLAGETGELEGFRILSTHDFVIELDQPVTFFLSVLGHTASSIVPEGTDFTNGREPFIGTGPFRVVRFDPSRRLELEANPYYWREGYPRADGLVFSFGATPGEILSRFRSGRFSLARDLFPADVTALRQDASLAARYEETPSLSTYLIAFNTRRGPFVDVRLRRRLIESIDIESIVRRHLGRLAIPAYGLIPPGLLGYEPPRRVRGNESQKIKGPDPIDVTAVVNSVYEGPYSSIFEDLCATFEQQGLRVRASEDIKAEYYVSGNIAEFDLVFQRWFADYPDADSFVHDVLHSEKGMVGRFCGTAEIDRLIERGRTEPNADVRHDIYREVEEIIAREAMLLPLFHELVYSFARPEVQGFELNFFAPIVAYEKLWLRS